LAWRPSRWWPRARPAHARRAAPLNLYLHQVPGRRRLRSQAKSQTETRDVRASRALPREGQSSFSARTAPFIVRRESRCREEAILASSLDLATLQDRIGRGLHAQHLARSIKQ